MKLVIMVVEFKEGEVVKEFETKNGKRIILRIPKSEDSDQLLEFINSLISDEEAFITFTRKKTEEENKKWLTDTLNKIKRRKTIYIIAEAEGKIIGNFEIKIPKPERTKHVGELAIFLLKDYRGLGIGSIMMETLLDLAKNMNLKIIRLETFGNNEIAMNFYKKFGFKEVGIIPKGVSFKEKYIDNVIMVKELD